MTLTIYLIVNEFTSALHAIIAIFSALRAINTLSLTPLTVVEIFPLTPFIKFIYLTNGNLKKTVNGVNERTTWNFTFLTVGTNR